MEHITQWIASVSFPYHLETPTTSEAEKDRRERREASREWMQMGAALSQVRRQGIPEKVAFLTLSRNYMSADRVSPYANPYDRSRLMTHKKAAETYRNDAAKLELDLNRARNGGRLRVPHH
jgi:hypothetical protein